MNNSTNSPRTLTHVTAAEKAQSAVDELIADNNIDVADIEAILSEHMRTPYIHAQEYCENPRLE